MARVNQGIYKKNRALYKKKHIEWEELEDQYFSECGFKGDREDVFDYLELANNLYHDVETLRMMNEMILDTQKFEQEGTEEYYKTSILDLQNIKKGLTERAGECRELLGYDVSENEKYSLDNWII